MYGDIEVTLVTRGDVTMTFGVTLLVTLLVGSAFGDMVLEMVALSVLPALIFAIKEPP